MKTRQLFTHLPQAICGVSLLGLVTVAVSTNALAQNAGNNAGPADIEAGQQAFYTCGGCHGIPSYNNVYPTYKVPKLGGQNEQYLINALHAYKNGTRQHPTMQIQAQSMSEQDIINIAAYLASMNSEEKS